ncbi:MAG: hypothetical protein AB7K24_05040, partial [Gemmataceae bacterium]
KDRAQQLREHAAPLLGKLRGLPPKVLLPVAGVAVLLFCLLPSFLVARWLFGGGSALGPGEKYLPDDCKVVASVRVDQVLASPLLEPFKKDFPELHDQIVKEGISKKTSRMLVAGSFDEKHPVVIFELTEAITADDAKKALKIADPKEEKEGEVALLVYPDAAGGKDMAFCLPDNYILLQGHAEDVRAILKRGKKPEFSKELQAALGQADLKSAVAVAASFKGLTIPPAESLNHIRAFVDKVEYGVLGMSLATDLDAKAALHCNEAKTAEELRDLLKGLRSIANLANPPKETGAILEAAKIDAAGNDVTFALLLKKDSFAGIKQMTDQALASISGSDDKYIPDDSSVIISMKVDQLFDSQVFKMLRRDFPEFRDQMDELTVPHKIERVVAAGNYQDKHALTAMYLKEPVTLAEAKTSFKVTDVKEEKSANVTLYRYPDPQRRFQRDPNTDLVFCFPEKLVLLQGPINKVKEILRRKKPQLDPELKKAMQLADKKASISMVAMLQGVPIPNGPGLDQFRKLAGQMQYAYLQIDVRDELDMRATVHCADEKTATELRDVSKGLLALAKTFGEMPKEGREIVDAIDFNLQGRDVLVSLKIKRALLERLKNLRGF